MATLLLYKLIYSNQVLKYYLAKLSFSFSRRSKMTASSSFPSLQLNSLSPLFSNVTGKILKTPFSWEIPNGFNPWVMSTPVWVHTPVELLDRHWTCSARSEAEPTVILLWFRGWPVSVDIISSWEWPGGKKHLFSVLWCQCVLPHCTYSYSLQFKLTVSNYWHVISYR